MSLISWFLNGTPTHHREHLQISVRISLMWPRAPFPNISDEASQQLPAQEETSSWRVIFKNTHAVKVIITNVLSCQSSLQSLDWSVKPVSDAERYCHTKIRNRLTEQRHLNDSRWIFFVCFCCLWLNAVIVMAGFIYCLALTGCWRTSLWRD